MNAAFSIFLVGMMGAGKSTVGIRLARRLDRVFIDADRELESRLGVSIPTIFELEGEEGFRRRETLLLDELSRRPGLVLATGGGVVLAPQNRQYLRSRGKVVYLQAHPADLWQRLRRDRQRPLLRTPNPRERIQRLCEEREPLYMEVATHTIATGRQPVDHIVEAIVQALGPSHDDADVSGYSQSTPPADSLADAARRRRHGQPGEVLQSAEPPPTDAQSGATGSTATPSFSGSGPREPSSQS